METVQFYNGKTMPKIGLGTYRVKMAMNVENL